MSKCECVASTVEATFQQVLKKSKRNLWNTLDALDTGCVKQVWASLGALPCSLGLHGGESIEFAQNEFLRVHPILSTVTSTGRQIKKPLVVLR